MDGIGSSATSELWPTYFLGGHKPHADRGSGSSSVALIVLNSPISSFAYFRKLYDSASFCICADAGADRLHDLLTSTVPGRTWQEILRSAMPDMIHGDLDSISDTVRRHYESMGVAVSRDPDQYSTDFGKAIKKVIENKPQVEDILVLGSLGGRIDQGIGLIHELYREQKFRHPEVRFWLFSEASVTVMLQPGSTTIHTPLGEGLIERNIGILPVYGPAVISTNGLEWDVKDWSTEMGGQVSTSNHIVADQIQVTTNKEVLFTVERRRRGLDSEAQGFWGGD